MGDIIQRFKDTPENLLALYGTMYRIRLFEDMVAKKYGEGEIPGFCHTYQGEEPIAAGVCAALAEGDVVFSTHRGHGHAIAQGVSVNELMAELYGKATGTNMGRGGSMHIYKKAAGFFGTNGLVGGGVGLAAGAAFELKYNKKPNVSVSFFGDGASNMGIFYETLNMASKWKLPVIFVCENNRYATVTPLRKIAANTEIASRGLAFRMENKCIDGNDATDVFEATAEARERAVAGEGPTLIEARTYRYMGHFVGDLLHGVYRTKEEMETRKYTGDALPAFRARLAQVYKIEEAQIVAIEEKIIREIDEAVEFARSSPSPDPSTAYDNLFVKESF